MSGARVRVGFEQGRPCLQILDADAHSVRMAWRAPAAGEAFDHMGLRDFCRECLLQQAVTRWWSDESRYPADATGLGSSTPGASTMLGAAPSGGRRPIGGRR